MSVIGSRIGEALKWEVMKQEFLLKTRWLTVRKDKVRMPTRVVIDDYYVLEYPDWINVIAITDEGMFVIERQYRHGTQTIDYELCAGTVEKGEEPLAAAKRELLEETGYADGEWELYCISAPNPASMTNKNYSFLAKGVRYTGKSHQESTEDIEVNLITYEELKTLVDEGAFLQGQMLAPLWKYIAENK